MHWMVHPYTISLLVAAVISIALAGSAWKTRTTINTRSFTILTLVVSLWASMHVFELAAPTLPGKVFWANMQFFSILSVPPALLSFVIRYTRRDHLLNPPRLALLLSFPLVILALVWTNDLHGWVFTRAEIVHLPPFTLLYRHFGVGFWISAGYCYAVILLSTVLLVRSMVTAPPRYRKQVLSLLIGVSVPWIGNAMYLFHIAPFSDFDITPVVFSISGLAFGWGVFRYRLLDIVPIAYDLLLNNMQDAVFVFDHHQRVLDLNPAAKALCGNQLKNSTGLTADALIPGWSDMVGPGEKTDFRQQVCLPTKNQNRYFDLSGARLKHHDQVFGYLVVLRDVTEYRQTQSALADSERQFKSLSENAPIAICTLDSGDLLTYANPEWKKVLGHGCEESVGRKFAEFILPDHMEAYTRAFQSIRDDLAVLSGLPVEMRHADGSRRFFSISASPNLNTDGKLDNIICLLKDQTEEHDLQAQLVQSQKMKAIGTLAGGIAHDFNNLLMGIQANISLLCMENGQSDKWSQRFDSIERQIQTGASLTRQLLGYARKGKYHPTLVCLNQLIQETLDGFGRTHKHLTIQSDLLAGLPPIHADRGQMELVLLNLLVNAADAMPDVGVLSVKTDLRVISPAEGQSLALAGGDYVHFQIADTGTGMDAKTLARVFEPFFTTKQMGRGTGLGLASVYGVVRNHKGSITVVSKPGQGSTFSLLFQAVAKGEQAPGCPQRLHTGSGRVLFVEDETDLLKTGTALLQRLGYQVAGADNGADALHALSADPDSFDLVIIDMIMPGMGGWELYGHIRRISPDMRVLLSTGAGNGGGILDMLSHDRSDIIRKPYTAEALSKKISTMLGR